MLPHLSSVVGIVGEKADDLRVFPSPGMVWTPIVPRYPCGSFKSGSADVGKHVASDRGEQQKHGVVVSRQNSPARNTQLPAKKGTRTEPTFVCRQVFVVACLLSIVLCCGEEGVGSLFLV